MSGHSKWSQIKHKKGVLDQKKGQIFSKISKVIYLAAKKGVNPETNFDLKKAIERARAINMPNDSIQRAINKTSDKSIQFEELLIEAIGPNNIAVKIKAITDNRNRTISEIKKLLADHSFKFAPGSTSWMLDQPIFLEESDIKKQITEFLEIIDNHDDVEEVISNLSLQ